MKTPPKYIQANAEQFLTAMQLIREHKYSTASFMIKQSGNKKLIQRIQQKIDANYAKRITDSKGCPTSRALKYFSTRINNKCQTNGGD